MAREDPQIKLRLAADLKGRVEEAARVSGRSVNAEIVHRLEQSLLSSDGLMSRLIGEITDVVAKELSERYGIPNIDPGLRPGAEFEGKPPTKPREDES